MHAHNRITSSRRPASGIGGSSAHRADPLDCSPVPDVIIGPLHLVPARCDYESNVPTRYDPPRAERSRPHIHRGATPSGLVSSLEVGYSRNELGPPSSLYLSRIAPHTSYGAGQYTWHPSAARAVRCCGRAASAASIVSALSACALVNPSGICWQSERIRPGTTVDCGLLVGSHFSGACTRVPGVHPELAGEVFDGGGVVVTAGADVVGEGKGVVGEDGCGARVVGSGVFPGDDEGVAGVLLGGVDDDDGGGGLAVGSAVPDCAPAISRSTATPAIPARNGIR
ncbi:Uncharacterised protein [Nocardia brasiliensis]|nr:Uncharacterised protein [Nocardia brasiliensis]